MPDREPLTVVAMHKWIKYSFKGLMMAKRLCKKKGWDYKNISEAVIEELMEENQIEMEL